MIKCPKCGKIVEEKKFCVYCGQILAAETNRAPIQNSSMQNASINPAKVSATVSEEPVEVEDKKSRKKKFPLFLAGAVLGGALGVAAFFLINPQQLKSEKQSEKIAGNGYDSPEAAMTAYLEALKCGDVEGMIATMPIETYVENNDFVKQLDYLSSYTVDTDPFAPSEDAYTEGLLRLKRRASLYYSLYWQYVHVTNPTDLSGKSILDDWHSQPIVVKEDYERFVDNLADDDWMKDLSKLTYGDILEVSDMKDVLPEAAYTEAWQENLDHIKERYGYDEYVPLAVEVEFQGKDYYITADAVCYDGRWYIRGSSGIINTLMGEVYEWIER